MNNVISNLNFSIKEQKLTTQSIANSNVTLTKNRWGATLICEKPQHATILLEGIKQDEVFRQIAHLTGAMRSNPAGGNGCSFFQTKVGKVVVENVNSSYMENVTNKSDTWVFVSHKIELFMVRLEEEKKKNYPFLILGGRSAFAKTAETINIYHPILAAINKIDANLFLGLYDSAQNNGLCTRMTQYEFDLAIEKALVKIQTTVYQKPKTNKRVGIVVVPSEQPKLAHIADEDSYLLDHHYSYSDLIELIMQEDQHVNRLSQQSCCTWAQKQLETLGVEMESSWLDTFVTYTPKYVKHKKNQMGQEVNLFEENQEQKIEEEIFLDGADVDQRRMHESLKGRSVSYDLYRNKTAKALEENKEKMKSSIVGMGFGGFGGGTLLFAGATLLSGGVILPALALGGIGAVTGTILTSISISEMKKLYQERKKIKAFINAKHNPEKKN